MSQTDNQPASRDDAGSPVPPFERLRAFDEAWRRGLRPRIEDHLRGVSDDELPALLCEMVRLDAHFRFLSGETPKLEEYQSRFPDADAAILNRSLEAAGQSSRSVRGPERNGLSPHEQETLDRHRSTPKLVGCPRCQNPVSLPENHRGEILCEACDNAFRLDDVYAGTTRTLEVRKLGRFQLVDRLGVGSFGTVWRALDPELDRTVAIKVLHAHLANSSAFRERFLREARAIAQLQHPGIVHLYEVPVVDGAPILVSDFIDGLPLHELLQRGRYSFAAVASLIADVADALDYAHQRGLVHRDIKPGNVMVAFPPANAASPAAAHAGEAERLPLSGKPVVVDFGLALRDSPETTMTMEGQLVGTPAYMSPEQVRHAHKVDGRSDVYSLGVVLYEMLCGELPFRGSKAMILHQVVHEEPRPPRLLDHQIPRDLQTICLKAMGKLPAWRYATAKEMAEDLRRYLRREPILARPTGPMERGWRWCRRNPVVAGLIAACIATLIAGTGASLHFGFQASARAREANASAAEAITSARRAEEAEELQQRLWYDAEIGHAARDWQDGRADWLAQHLDAVLPEQTGGRDLRGLEWSILSRLTQSDLQTFTGHRGQVSAVALAPGGRFIASSGGDGIVRIWDLAQGKEIWMLAGHGSLVGCIAFHPDGHTLVSGGDDGTVSIWDVKRGMKIREMPRQSAAIRAVTFTGNGSRLVVVTGSRKISRAKKDASLLGGITFWDLKTDSQFLPPLHFALPHFVMALRPDGNALAWVNDVHVTGAIDLRSGEEWLPFGQSTTWVNSVAFSRDNRRIAWVGDGQRLSIWDQDSKREVVSALGRRPGSDFMSVAFSGDGHIAAGTRDGAIEVLSDQSGAELRQLFGHQAAVSSLAFSQDSRQLFSGSFDGSVRVWDARTDPDPVILMEAGTVHSIAFDSSGRLGCAAGDNLDIWEPGFRHRSVRIRHLSSSANALAFSPDRRLFVSGHRDGTIVYWDGVTGTEVVRAAAHKSLVGSLLFTADGTRIISAGYDGAVKSWSAGAKLWSPPEEDAQTLMRCSSGVLKLARSSDGRLLAVACGDGTVSVWSFTEKRVLLSFKKHTGAVYDIAFHPVEPTIISAGSDDKVRIWDCFSGADNKAISVGAVKTVLFSPDGRRVVTTDWGRSVRIWDSMTGQELLSLPGHSTPVLDAAFSLDGSYLATGSSDGRICIWDLKSSRSELREDRVARSVVEFLRNGCAASQVMKRVQNDETIGERVRQKAVEIAKDSVDR